MRKFPVFVGLGFLTILMLGGCVTTAPVATAPPVYVGPPVVTEGSPAWVRTAQAYVADKCYRFYPTAETIRSLFNSGDPTLQTLSGLAATICNAIQPPPSVVAVASPSVTPVALMSMSMPPQRRSITVQGTYQVRAQIPTATGGSTVKIIKIEGRRV